jgi:uncharacterized protein HemX/uroporphyrinogen-III synthase
LETSLKDRGILVTRPAAQAERLAALLAAAGARPIVFPAIDIEPLAPSAAPAAEGVDLVVFVSPTAAQIGSAHFRSAASAVAAVGSGTKRELEAQGFTNVLAPHGAADSEALLALSELQDMAGKRVLIVRGEGGREVLAESLAARGARVDYFECYRRVAPRADPSPLIAAWERGEVDAVTLSSSQALDNLTGLVGAARLEKTPVFVNHARVAERAREAGIAHVVVAGSGDEETVDALVAYFGSRMQSQPTEPAVAGKAPERRSRVPLLLVAAIVVACALATVFWLDARQRIDATQQELARRLRDIEGDSREVRSLARQSDEAQRETRTRLGQLEAKLAESQSQQVALEALYQELSRNRDEWHLAEIEQVLAIASQQLQLAGNVRAALLALQLAEARLARADRPQFMPIRRALANDIERLKSLPSLDIPAMSLRLDSIAAQVDSLPLAFDERGEPNAPAGEVSPDAGRGFWSRLSDEVWKELRSLIVVRQMDKPEPPLLPPTQAFFVRENLRLRLLNARLSLLARDETGYRQDLQTAQRWIERYFDARSRPAQEALNQLKQLSSANLSFQVPTINESLEAVRGYKTRRERAPG